MAPLPWHTSVSILVAGGLVASAVYFALRSPTPPNPTAEQELAASSSDRAIVRSTMAERDRQRRWDEQDQAEVQSPVPAGGEAPRDEDRVEESEQALAVAPAMLGLPPVPSALSQRVERDAGEAFENLRDRVRSECWKAGSDGPDSVDVVLSLSYGSDGKLLASGVSEDRERSREGLATCLGPLIHQLDVPAPGSNLSIELRVAIP